MSEPVQFEVLDYRDETTIARDVKTVYQLDQDRIEGGNFPGAAKYRVSITVERLEPDSE